MESLFIAWSNHDAKRIAEQVRSFFQPYAAHIEVFFSDWDIECGDSFDSSIRSALNKATCALILFAQEAGDSEYFTYECSTLCARIDMPTIMMMGASTDMLPLPIAGRQKQPLDRNNVKRFLEELVNRSGIRDSGVKRSISDRLDKIDPIWKAYEASNVIADDDHWRRGDFTRVISISRASLSPYELAQVIRISRRELILIAQNHGFMVFNEPDLIWGLLEEKIRNGLKVTIAAMHQGVPGAYSSGEDAAAIWSSYMSVGKFKQQMDQCWELLSKWWVEVKEAQYSGSLRVMGTDFLPLTMSFVDPTDEQRGLAIISPRLRNEASSTARPQFVLKKRYSRNMFNYYYEAYVHDQIVGTWRDISELEPDQTVGRLRPKKIVRRRPKTIKPPEVARPDIS